MRLLRLPVRLRWLATRSWPDLPTAARRRHESIALVERLVAAGLPIRKACTIVGISKSSYYRWVKQLSLFGPDGLKDGRAGSRRRRTAPAQNLVREQVTNIRERYPLGKEKLRVVLAREGLVVSSSTVQRVLSNLFERGLVHRIGYGIRTSGRQRNAAKRVHATRKKSHQKPLAPGELVQIDTLHEGTVVGRKRYQFTAVDPTTRRLHAGIYPSASSANAATFLESLIEASPFSIRSVQVDNGSEYKGDFEKACQLHNINLFTIPPATPKANGMVERCQRTCREEHYAYETESTSRTQDQAALTAFIDYYNHIRPHQALNYLTPNEYTQTRNLQEVSQLG